MRLFRRKATSEDEGERCPRCRERVPEGADECLMCGVDLRPLASRLARPEGRSARAQRQVSRTSLKARC
jgi:hypothetical protein